MAEREYKPNSYKYKEEQKNATTEERRVEKVVTGPVKTKKKNGVSKLTDIFIAEDAANVKSYIFMDVLVPAIKKAVSDIVTDGIDMILYGGTGRSKKTSSGSKISYSSYYSGKKEDRYEAPHTRSRFDFDDIVFSTRAEAEAVRMQMLEVIDRYDFVTVGDMYDMADLSQPYTSNKYGWTSLNAVRSAETVRVRDGYIIKLPKPGPID